MDIQSLYYHIWSDFASLNTCAHRLFNIFKEQRDSIVWDDIAFRTINDPRVNIVAVARPFVNMGYQPVAELAFDDQSVRSVYYKIPGSERTPGIFISELLLEDMSPMLQSSLDKIIIHAEHHRKNSELIFAANPFEPLSYPIYDALRQESSFAAWFYVYGFRANFMSVCIGDVVNRIPLNRKIKLLIENGFQLRTPYGEVKGSSNASLWKSETLTENLYISFEQGILEIPGCFYEFFQHYSIPGNSMPGSALPTYTQSGVR